ncbi:MAG TPA: arabinan endo-1,5-alpha-L-arabinosidase [Planctomycetaceae bacterium]|nr:arabinan endo-1,5-alpha-L-arabinosidase [Planctomycetaceae bacterium]
MFQLRRLISVRRLARFVSFAGAIVAAIPTSGQEGDVRRVHDPCIIKADGWYYVFSTSGGIQIRRSRDLWHWKRVGEVFDRIPSWTKKAVPGVKSLWAPDIAYFRGWYRLYYSVSTFGKNRSCIGLAINRTLDPSDKRYRWIDRGPVISSRPGRDNFNAIDPNVVFDGRQPWLAFGSFWSGIKLIQLDPETGLRSARGRTIYSIASRTGGAIEAPFVIKRGRFFYLFVSFDRCCRGIKSTYKIKVGRSERITGPYKDRAGRPMMKGGGTLVLAGYGRYRGPGHNAVLSEKGRSWLVHHFYDAQHAGVATLQIRPLLWDSDGWPLVGDPGVSAQTGSATSRRLDRPNVVGPWNVSIDFGEERVVRFLADGLIQGVGSRATWALRRNRLVLRLPSVTGLRVGGAVECFFAADGRWFVGRSSDGAVVRGRRVRQAGEHSTTLGFSRLRSTFALLEGPW